MSLAVTPAISLGVPVYNGVAGIRSLVESLLSDPFQNLEIVISDNGSTDGSRDLLSRLLFCI